MEEKIITGYPSIDKPWLKYYSEEAINAPLPECTIYEYLWENNKDHLDDIAINYLGKKITFGELFDNIDKTARAFLAQGITSGDVITIVSLSCVNSVVVFYAINKIGAISNFVNVLASEDELSAYLRDANSACVVSLDLFAEKVIKAAEKTGTKKFLLYSLSDYMPQPIQTAFRIKLKCSKLTVPRDNRIIWWRDFLASSTQEVGIIESTNRDAVSLWAHTGGTTGFPKTVLLTNKAYNAVAMQYMESMPHERGQVFLNIIVPFVVYGTLVCMHMPLSLGLTVAIIPKFEASDWRKYFLKYKPNHIAGIPTYFSPMLKDRSLNTVDLSGLITLAAGGDGMNKPLEEELNAFLAMHGSKAVVIKGYGMTEVCSSAVTTFNNYSKIGSVGIPLVQNNIRVFDHEKMAECKYGEIGEILLSSPSIMAGYKDNQSATDALISTDPSGVSWVHTEDLGYVDTEGFLFLLGRMKRVMLVGPEGMAYKVFPKMIEDVILTIPKVQDVCVVSAYNGADLAPKAYIVLVRDYLGQEQQATEEIRKTCEKKLADYLRPFCYEYLESLPLTSVGKVDYAALEERAMRGE